VKEDVSHGQQAEEKEEDEEELRTGAPRIEAASSAFRIREAP
jgi:hypothetical protein